jgi:anti-sigma B factor antagonist
LSTEPSLQRRGEGAWTVIEVAGELDLHSAPALREQLAEASAREPARVAVDLTRVSFMDSSTLGILVSSLKHARERGGDLVLIGVNGSPGKVLSVTGLDQVFRLVPSVGSLTEPR